METAEAEARRASKGAPATEERNRAGSRPSDPEVEARRASKGDAARASIAASGSERGAERARSRPSTESAPATEERNRAGSRPSDPEAEPRRASKGDARRPSGSAPTDVDALLDSIPCTAGRPRQVEDLPGGLTNRNLKVTTPAGTVVVRIPAAGPGLLGIDREHEHANSRAAAEAGVGAPVLHYRPGEGLVVGFLPGRPLTDDDLHEPAVLRRVAAACRRLHAGPRFVNDFDMFDTQARYRRIVAEHGFRLPGRYDEFAAAVARIREVLPPQPTVPCNNDLLAANLLDDGETVRIIDYEYSGNNDPCFELGNIWSEAALSPPLLDVLVTAYYGRPRPAQVARARLLGLMSKYGWTLWASIQHGSSPLDFDFWSWGMEKYDRAVAEFDGPDFERLLETAGRGD